MNTSTQGRSQFYHSFRTDIDALAGIEGSPLLNRMAFSQAITVMEKYLYDVFLSEISSNDRKLQRLANENRFKEQKLSVAFALNNSVGDWMIRSMRMMVWHRLNDVQIIYKNVLGLVFEIERPVIDAINRRHHLVHRNGFDLRGEAINITESDLCALFRSLDDFVSTIDEAYMS